MRASEVQAVIDSYPIGQAVAPHTNLARSGKYLKGLCPFHPEKTGSFMVDVATGRWRCFGQCATAWLDVIDFFGWLKFGARWNARDPDQFKEVFSELKNGRPGVSVRTPRPAPQAKAGVPKTNDVMQLLHRASQFYELQLWQIGAGPDTPLAYLHTRGFSTETIRAARLGYCTGDGLKSYLKRGGIPLDLARAMHLLKGQQGDREFFKGRIIFPELDPRGQIIHICGRAWASFLGAGAVKYLALKEFDKPIYGWQSLDKSPSPLPVFVDESPPDRLTLMQWGFEALATLGTSLRPSSAKLLAGLQRPIVYLPHNDGGAGLQAALRWRAEVGHGTILELPPPG